MANNNESATTPKPKKISPTKRSLIPRELTAYQYFTGIDLSVYSDNQTGCNSASEQQGLLGVGDTGQQLHKQ